MASALADDNPAVLFINRILTDCLKNGADEIRFENKGGLFTVVSVVGGSPRELACEDSELWDSVVNRIRIMARVIQHGPVTAQDRYISVQHAGGSPVVFRLTPVPDPKSSHTIILRREKGTDGSIGR